MPAPRRRPQAVQEDVPGTGECVLLDRESGRILALNPTGAAVWDLLDGERDANGIAEVLSTVTGVSREQAERDVTALLDQLAREGFLDEGPQD